MGSCGVDIVSGIPLGSIPNLQQVCDVGNTTTTAMAVGGAAVADAVATDDDLVVGLLTTDNHGITIPTLRLASIGATNVAGARDACFLFDTTGNVIYIYLNGSARYRATINEFRPDSDNARNIGIATARFQFGYIAQHAVDVVSVGDASYVVSGNAVGFITIAAPAAGNNDITLDGAVVGMTLFVEIDTAGAGAVRLVGTGGDAFTLDGIGAPSPASLGGATGLWMIVAETANLWRVNQIR